MKEKSTRNLIILIVIVLIIAVLAAVYFFTQKEDVKEQKEEFQNRADELKKKILAKEGLVSSLILKVEGLKLLDEFIVNQGKQVCKTVKLAILGIGITLFLSIYCLYSFELWKGLLTTVALLGLSYKLITIYALNRIGDFNKALKTFEDFFILREYVKYNFEPTLIFALEEQLITEQNELVLLKEQHLRILSSNTNE